jgi:hypothetical protein
MSTTLNEASKQWASRPVDERFWTVQDFIDATTKRREQSVERVVATGQLRFVGNDDGVTLRMPTGEDVALGHLSYTQLANKLEYPVKGVLPGVLPNPLIAEVLNARLAKLSPDSKMQILLLNQDGKFSIRCATSEIYARFWDNQLSTMLRMMEANGWIIPPGRPVGLEGEKTRQATEQDVLWLENAGGGTSVKVGDYIAPAGIYSGDRNSFIFMINQKSAFEDDVGNVLYRGQIITNSEVGEGAFTKTKFLMQGVCGNHIIWDAQDIVSISYRHVGNAPQRILEAITQIQDGDNVAVQQQIKRVFAWMRSNPLGTTKEEVVENVYAMRLGGNITQSLLHDAIGNAAAYRDVDGDPFTWMGLMNAVTRWSQTLANADERHQVDKQISKMTIKATKFIK